MNAQTHEDVYQSLVDGLMANGFGNKLVKYGSYYVCEPPVEDTDVDWFFYVDEAKQKDLRRFLEGVGFYEIVTQGIDSSRPTWGDEDPDRRFESYRMGIYNVVVTSSEVFRDRHNAATKLCKRLNLMNKEDRVKVYQAVLYGIYNE